MPNVVVYGGAATPADVILRLFVGDAVVVTTINRTIILYADVAVATTVTTQALDVTLYGSVAPDVVLRGVTIPPPARINRTYQVILRTFGALTEEPAPPPPPPPGGTSHFLLLMGVG